ncbi:unnamed protein product [Rotaria sp. Silwood1]|nr:unnamed protein product [Rotaria sp. Silwood1]CAF4797123.1 unnamed protein product [Rotaria sp. Silwood1]
MYYPTVVQPTSAETWPNAYQINTQQQQAIPAIYYQVPTVTVPSFPTTTTVPEAIVAQQPVPTVYYQTPSVTVPPIPTTTTSQTNIQQQPQTTSITTTKTTRILDPTTLPTIDQNSVSKEIKTTTTATKPEISTTQTIVTSTATNGPQVTRTTVAPTVETTIIQERPQNQPRRLRSLSTSTYSGSTTTSTHSTITPQPEIIQQPVVLPPPPPPVPIQTTTIAPVRRVIHHAHHHRQRTPSSYYSSDLDYGKQKVYKTDYKYRHYYCCNVCKGRCDLRNRSYGCCEWFYGCPVWALILCGLFFLALLITFLTLFGLQPSINSTRRAETAETRLLNRTQIIYGFYKNCGYQINATSNTPTTLILCTNTATTTTARIELSSFYTVISETNYYTYSKILTLILLFICFENLKF